MHEVLHVSYGVTKLRVVAHACNLSTQEVQAGGPERFKFTLNFIPN